MNSADRATTTKPFSAGGVAGRASTPRPLLSVRHLKVHFKPRSLLPWKRGGLIHAVDDLHLDLRQGETLVIVGEAGSGKSALARTLAGLDVPTSGSMRLDGNELAGLSAKQRRPLRREVQLLLNDPLADVRSRRKKLTVGELLGGSLQELQPELDEVQRRRRLDEVLLRVGLAPELAARKVHDLPAAHLRRVAVARAIAALPKLLICDEPAADLEAAEQSALIELLAGLQAEHGLTMIFVSRDFELAHQLGARLAVMYFGKLMEQAPADALLARPRHPYTRALLAQLSPAGAEAANDGEGAVTMEGEPGNPLDPPMGCVFHPRCPFAEAICVRTVPNLRRVGAEHYAACHFVGEA